MINKVNVSTANKMYTKMLKKINNEFKKKFNIKKIKKNQRLCLKLLLDKSSVTNY